jgi:hypothetical protein
MRGRIVGGGQRGVVGVVGVFRGDDVFLSVPVYSKGDGMGGTYCKAKA